MTTHRDATHAPKASRRRDQLLSTLTQWPWQKGYGPTISDLQRIMNWSSKSLVHRYVRQLALIGVIEVAKDEPRGITLRPAPTTACTACTGYAEVTGYTGYTGCTEVD